MTKSPTRVTRSHQAELREAAIVLRNEVRKFRLANQGNPLQHLILEDIAIIIDSIGRVGVKEEENA